MQLILASHNSKKLTELKTLLGGLGLAVVGAHQLGLAAPPEPYGTFVENALSKARHAAQHGGAAAIADDSGLCVQALGGAPGVHSARLALEAGLPASDANNNQVLLEKMAHHADRHARFISVLVAIRSAHDPEPLICMGRWEGRLLYTPQGKNGFGYDPLLFIDSLGHSVAELSSLQKNTYSHRALAAQQMRTLMQGVWGLAPCLP
jgi:XTP/dITP diphosphohydrolase